MKNISRRSFLEVSIGLGIVAGCSAPTTPKGPLPLGPVSKFPEGKTALDVFRVQIIRNGSELRAISLLCTHQTCLLTPQAEGFDCPCHGSTFDLKGRKLSGPAPLDLPWYELTMSPQGELLLHRDRQVSAEWSLKIS